MTGLLREVGRVRRAMEQFTAAGERVEVFSVRLEELAVLRAGDSFALLTGSPGVDQTILRQLSQLEGRSATMEEKQPLPHWKNAAGWHVGQTLSSVNPAVTASRSLPLTERWTETTSPLHGKQDLRVPSASRHGDAVEPFSRSTTVLAQRFAHAGLKSAWEAAFHTAVEPPPSRPAGPAPAVTAALSQQLLRMVERAERTGRARTLAQGRPGVTGRRIPMAAEDRESVPRRPLTRAEAEELRAATTAAPANRVASRQWPTPAGVAPDQEWDAAADNDGAPQQPWVPRTGSGLRRLASLAGVPPGDPARQDAAAAPRHGARDAGHADFVTRLEEALRAEAIRSGIDPEELIR